MNFYSPKKTVIRVLIATLTLFWLNLIMASSVFAEEGRHWVFTPSLSFYFQYSDNIDLSYNQPVTGFKTELEPGFCFVLPSPRRQIKISTFLRFDTRMRSDANNATLSWISTYAYYGREVSPRTSYELDSSLDITYTEKDLGAPFVGMAGALTRVIILRLSPTIRYRWSRTTLFKAAYAFKYTMVDETIGVGGMENSVAFWGEKEFGPRLRLGIGATYSMKTFSNDTGYTEYMVPVELDLALSLFKIKIKTGYLSRTGDAGYSYAVPLYGIGLEMGGELFRLRATTFEISITSTCYDDMYGEAYENQEVKIMAYRIFEKFDAYLEFKYGNNIYLNQDDTASLFGLSSDVRWYLSPKSNLEFQLGYTTYNYAPSGNAFNVMTASVDYSYNLYASWFLGIGIAHRNSSASTDEGNYMENLYALFARASW